RYFPEPDLLSIQITRELVQQVSASLPELPAAKLNRLMREYPLTFSEASILVEETTLADFFEQTAKSSKEPKQSVNWILRDLLEKLKESRLAVSESPVGPEQLAEMISLIQKGIISHNQGKEVFQQMWQTRKSPAQIIQEKGMVQISKEEELNRIIEQVFAENPDIVKRYKNGEMKLQGVLVGLVMKASGGKANPGIVNRLLKEQLE
ncbi:MAG TPA: Asp-tRNA(Asn)/Glu-tRNA(Gln) amidotransferase GatCAB subunit B, partial [Acidobacteriota bacterium]